MIRSAACAGTWYPGDKEGLAREVDDLLAKAKPVDLSGGRVLALIAPHAGYRFSAAVAAAGYAPLRQQKCQRAIVVAFSHRAASTYNGIDVPAKLSAYETPLGAVPIDRPACDGLLRRPPFVSQSGVDRDEHSLELQLPFLQRTLGDFKLVPLLVGRMNDADYVKAAEALLPLLDETTVLVASSDFTHFGPRFQYEPFREDVPRRLQELADQAASPLLACDYDGFQSHIRNTQDTICGRGPISLVLRALSMQGGARGVRAACDTSGRMTSDWDNSVTYQAIVFTRRPGTLAAGERDTLLHLARETATAHLSGSQPPRPKADDLPAALRADGACFVTLQNHGNLRGCIGNMEAADPLFEAVIRNAVSACQDHRFAGNPVTTAELADINIEISYLTPMRRVARIEDVVIGRHGLLISASGRRGVLLPQVAYERGWSREEFLGQVCRKAGLPPESWKQKDAELYCFEAEVFGEHGR